jgi:hypothetical protein
MVGRRRGVESEPGADADRVRPGARLTVR